MFSQNAVWTLRLKFPKNLIRNPARRPRFQSSLAHLSLRTISPASVHLNHFKTQLKHLTSDRKSVPKTPPFGTRSLKIQRRGEKPKPKSPHRTARFEICGRTRQLAFAARCELCRWVAPRSPRARSPVRTRLPQSLGSGPGFRVRRRTSFVLRACARPPNRYHQL